MSTPVNIGIIGGGLMGKEIASAILRWPALIDHPSRPALTAVCDINPDALDWFDQITTVTRKVTDYRELLALDDVDVVYIAVRHDLHEEMYVAAVEAGKDVFAEKPFGIDLRAAQRIVASIDAHPDRVVRCSSEMPFFPGAQAAIDYVRAGRLGRIIEATSWFSHSSDLNIDKPINWKRQVEYCGEAGVMNDLGMHAVHVPLRLGWKPASVFSVLQNLVETRRNAEGEAVPCSTFENATLICDVEHDDVSFPLTIATKRIDPGQKNTWGFRALGMSGGVEFTTRYPTTLRVMTTQEDEQVWQEIEMGSQAGFPTVTGGIFETGFSDAILQMWAAFLAERDGRLGERFGCVTPTEALDSHRIFDAALRSHQSRRAESVDAR